MPRSTRPVNDERPGGSGGLTRRELLKRGAVVGAVVSLPAVGTASVGNAFAAPARAVRPSALTPDQSAVLEALVDRMVPADANGPGGVQAGAAAFIEKALGGGLAGGLTAAAPLYAANLPAVDAYAKSRYGQAFTALSPAQKDSVLGDIATGKATGFTPDSMTFFLALHEHTLHGMFSDPAYGGNRNFAGWDLLGFPGIKMPVSAHDQKIGVKVKPAHRSTYAGGAYAKARREAIA